MMLALLLAAAPASREAAFLAEANRARTRPAETAAALRRYAASFRGDTAYEDGPDGGWTTIEGARPVAEAADALDRQAPLPPLRASPLLARAARMLAEDQARTGATGHLTADRRGPGDRARAAGGDAYVTEVIAYGFETPERGVRQLLIDDGVRGRGHRVLLLSPRARHAGVACAHHPALRVACVMLLSEMPDGAPTVPPRGP